MVNKVIKRDGSIVDFDIQKIENAVLKAMNEVNYEHKDFVKCVSIPISNIDKEEMSVEEIQDEVETLLMRSKMTDVAKAYIRYRYKREQERAVKNNFAKRYEQVESLINCTNEEATKENSNKDTRIASVMRDYIAGFTCKEMARAIIPEDIMKAHNDGVIHFHDLDYSPVMPIHNCELINLEDMLQNGTVINETMIESPKSFRTACTVTSQISALVSSSSYGGQTINLAHLAPFVDVSRKKIRKEVMSEFDAIKGMTIDGLKDLIDSTVEKRLKTEISDGIQTLYYQWLTLNSTNGQAPFVTLFMYIDDVPKGKTRDDLVMLIEEVLRQRIKGVKNKKGEYITTAFPKLIYVLDEDNIHEDSEYYWLTELACECSAKRLVPDYVSAKKMKELKEGNVVAPMGCLGKDETIIFKFKNNDVIYTEAFGRFWNWMAEKFPVKIQPNGKDEYIDLDGVMIYDSKLKDFTDCYRVIRNTNDRWVNVHLTNGRYLKVTDNHPFETENRGVVLARDLDIEDEILIDSENPSNELIDVDPDIAWLLGLLICDSSYVESITASIGMDEPEIVEKWFKVLEKIGYKPDMKEWHRGAKGNYIDLKVKTVGENTIKKFRESLIELFGGVKKIDRRVPIKISSWRKESKLAFLAGMIDADGHLNPKNKSMRIGSTNKELALGQMNIAQMLGMPAKIYPNHYNAQHPEKLRYTVDFYPTEELAKYIQCKKKYESIDFTKDPKRNIQHSAFIKAVDIYKQEPEYSYDVTTASEHFTVSNVYSHNCRSMLSPWKDENGEYKLWGRFNQGVVTLNLPDIALSSEGNFDDFWKIFEERLELCFRALMIRHNSLKGVKASIAPILWQNGALARLNEDDVIDPLLYGGYSTISLGYAGLYETVKYMTGKSHTEEDGREFGLKIMNYLADTVTKWKKETNIGFALYGSPIENTTDKFAKCLVKRFGLIEGITDKGYITNSYHITPSEHIDAFSKLSKEAEFQELSLGGAISYVETPSLEKNISAVMAIVKHIYETNMYAEINTTTSYCHVCGCRDLKMEDDLKYHCPNCGNDDWNKMNIAVRVCGYISTNPYVDGRAKDIHDRVYHIGDD